MWPFRDARKGAKEEVSCIRAIDMLDRSLENAIYALQRFYRSEGIHTPHSELAERGVDRLSDLLISLDRLRESKQDDRSRRDDFWFQFNRAVGDIEWPTRAARDGLRDLVGPLMSKDEDERRKARQHCEGVAGQFFRMNEDAYRTLKHMREFLSGDSKPDGGS